VVEKLKKKMYNCLIKKITTPLALLSVLLIISCKTSTVHINAQKEIGKWKNELINKKMIGAPCSYKDVSRQQASEWLKENPGQMDAFPSDGKSISTVNADFDGDGKQDLLLYFLSENCTGHNGDTPSFARIVYADGTYTSDLMTEIRLSILDKYNEKRKSEKLKEITDSYFNESVTISYDNGIKGEFKLYANDDAHCCPSYKGTYFYDVNGKKIEILLN